MKTSVVIPSYNSQQHIRLCLGALLKQTVAPDEIIVVDSSTDETPDIIRREFPTVRLHRLEKQTMPGRGRNIGMDLASGDIILFTDSDAVADPDWVKKHIHLHETMPDVILFGGSILNCNPEHLFSRLAFISEFTGYSKKDPAESRAVVPSVNMSAKRARLSACGVRMPEESMPGGEDVFFCNALTKAGMTIRFDPAPSVRHINRSTWSAYLGHMRSSGQAAGRIAAGHAVDYRWLVRLGPLAVLAVPVRLWRIWSRMLRVGGAAFAESLLLGPALAWGLSVQMIHFWRGSRHA
jgi:O-antigen biosynthesis protein